MELPPGFEAARRRARSHLGGVHGHLNDKEADFLFLLGAVKTAAGAVLEIGSFQGRSTILLAEASRLAGEDGVVAVDPLTSPAATDPDLRGADSAEPEFRGNLARAGVAERVEFHHRLSQELAREWTRPLRLLWIDGDHTLAGARRDLALFSRHLEPGGIAALHDVLHRHPGPMRVFMEDVLLSEDYGACGLCGSIGWAQRVAGREAAMRHRGAKLRLWRRLAGVLPLAVFKQRGSARDRRVWKLRRNFIPHGPVDPRAWLRSLDQPVAAPAQ